MRLGRLLLASLTALAAYSYTQAAPVVRHETLPSLLQAVVPLFAAATEATTSAPVAHSTQAILDLSALTATPLAGSIVLLASFIAINLAMRRHQRSLLRC